jgi:hypothetical protein
MWTHINDFHYNILQGRKEDKTWNILLSLQACRNGY